MRIRADPDTQHCTSKLYHLHYFTHITDNTKNDKSRVLMIPVNKRLLVQGVRSGGEERGLPRPAGGGAPVPVLLTQLLLKQGHFFLSQSYPAYRKPVLWIRIPINLADLDPDPYWVCGSGSRSMEIDQNLQINLISCLQLLYLRRYVL
jgi:hypothetical protein